MLIGPSCAGKSTYAASTYLAEEILSSDEIRVELFGSMSMAGSQQRVFEVLRDRAMGRLSTGRSVVIDATNIHQRDRLANAFIVPSDVTVEYVLIDRPMSEKQRDAGWRAEKPQLLENHANAFARELPDILLGDNLPNVVVRDLRAGAVAI
jgi:predicted kinase